LVSVMESSVIRIGELSLPAEPARVSEARRHVASIIRDWQLGVDVDTAVLLTSEVFTNAIVHAAAPGEVIRLVEAWDGTRFRIEVHDSRSGALEPEPAWEWDDRTLDSMAGESGRGLGMVELLAETWGVEKTDMGKQVYFTLGPPALP
jgi:anti-sigma regulatory factor (Ser/Thr protein kinase)